MLTLKDIEFEFKRLKQNMEDTQDIYNLVYFFKHNRFKPSQSNPYPYVRLSKHGFIVTKDYVFEITELGLSLIKDYI